MSLDLAHELIDAGIPVVVCTPRLDWKPGDKNLDLVPPGGWSVVTAAECDLSGFRPGVDTLAMVGGHGVDVVDCDTKAPGYGSLDNMPPYRRFGRTGTPSGGTHDYVRSTGIGKISPFGTSAGHVGDYVGGTPQGGSRLLAFLPGSTRPKYPGLTYTVIEPLRLAELLENDPDDDLMGVLLACGGTRNGLPGKPSASLTAVRTFLAEHSTEPEHRCAYGRAAITGLLDKAKATIPGDPKAGRHGWAVRSATRCVELVRAGCAWSGDLDTLEAELDRIKPEGGTDWTGVLAWAVNNASGTVKCGLHNPAAIAPTAERPDATDTAQGSTQPPQDDLEAVRRRFPRLDLAALLSANRPPREWVIPGLIPAGASVALVAPAGTGKSLLLLSAMIGVARGDRAFAGLPIPRGRRVVLVDMENTEDDLDDRLTALGITAADVDSLDDLVILHLPPLAPLDTVAGGAELAALLDAYHVKSGDVVVLDSLQRVIKGPENDSDTMRAFYACTGIELKRRGLTVVRTDNTGHVVAKGARGTSGKRDDVDVELILTRDTDHPDRLRIRPGKSRLPDITSVLINRDTDEDGHLTFTTAGDPFRALVGDAHEVLKLLNIPMETGERKAAETIKASGQAVVRAALRVAIKERKNPLWVVPEMPEMPTPSMLGAPLGTEPETDRAEPSRRTNGAPVENGESKHEKRAEPSRRIPRAHDAGAPADSAPPLPLSKERRAGARDRLNLPCPDCGEPKDLPAPTHCTAAAAHGRQVS
jgi:AAA domain